MLAFAVPKVAIIFIQRCVLQLASAVQVCCMSYLHAYGSSSCTGCCAPAERLRVLLLTNTTRMLTDPVMCLMNMCIDRSLANCCSQSFCGQNVETRFRIRVSTGVLKTSRLPTWVAKPTPKFCWMRFCVGSPLVTKFLGGQVIFFLGRTCSCWMHCSKLIHG